MNGNQEAVLRKPLASVTNTSQNYPKPNADVQFKVLVLATTYPPKVHGAAIAVKRLAEVMANRGHRVVVVTRWNSGKSKPESSRNLHVSPIRMRGRSDITLVVRLLSRASLKVRNDRPDIVHAHGNVAGIVALMLKLRYGTTYIISFHQLDVFNSSNKIDTSVKRRIVRILMKITSQHAAKVQVPSELVASEFSRLLNIEQSKFLVVPNPVNIRPPDDSSPQTSHKGRFILSVCLLMPRKGVDILLRAMPPILQDFPDLQLMVAGDGSQRHYLEGLALELRIAHRVRFLGFVTGRELSDLYSSCLIVVNPAREELFGMTMAEAMFFAKPVVASETMGAKSLIKDGENGVLVPIDDPERLSRVIHYLIMNPSIAARLGTQAQSFAVDHLTDEQIAIRYEACFSELLSKGN
jgi:glycosyltransferase involved in cell wall biosynthesis